MITFSSTYVMLLSKFTKFVWTCMFWGRGVVNIWFYLLILCMNMGSLLLPHNLVLTEILTRVPIESLLCFLSVCKLWKLTIIDPSLVKSHMNRTSQNPTDENQTLIGAFASGKAYILKVTEVTHPILVLTLFSFLFSINFF